MTMIENPRERIGGNNPPLAKQISETTDFAQTVTDYLADEFAASPIAVAALLDEARAAPNPITNDHDRAVYPSLIKRIRDEAKRLDAYHEKEATPYLRGKQAVDQFFFGLIDRCARRDKKGNPGAADVLNARLTVYDTAALLAEQERRRKEAAEAARKAAQAAADEAAKVRAAEEARLAAERARAPVQVAAKASIADATEAEASTAAVSASIAAAQAQEAHIATLAKPADIMRTRDAATGTLSTMATEPYAEVTDAALLDKEKLWPFIKLEAKEAALRAWAKNVGHTQQMAGASIGKRPRSVVR